MKRVAQPFERGHGCRHLVMRDPQVAVAHGPAAGRRVDGVRQVSTLEDDRTDPGIGQHSQDAAQLALALHGDKGCMLVLGAQLRLEGRRARAEEIVNVKRGIEQRAKIVCAGLCGQPHPLRSRQSGQPRRQFWMGEGKQDGWPNPMTGAGYGRGHGWRYFILQCCAHVERPVVIHVEAV